MKKLDICVPTFNRPQHLQEFLSNLKDSKLNENCNIHITDNSSTDPKVREAKKYALSISGIKWYENYANFGGNVNILLAASRGNSDYLIVSGDDDILLPSLGQLDGILGELNPDLVMLEKAKFKNRRLGQYKLYSLLQELSRDPFRLNELSHITSIIHKRANFSHLDGMKNINSFYPHVWAWLGNFFSLPEPSRLNYKVLVLPEEDYIVQSGIYLNNKRASVDANDIIEQQTLENGFQKGLFEIWYTIFTSLHGDNITTRESLIHKYCKSLDRSFPGSYEYIKSRVV